MSLRMLIAAAAVVLAGATSTAQQKPSVAPPVAGVGDLAELWSDPVDLPRRDFFNGPWGAQQAPDPDATYTFIAPKKGGNNPGMTVRDPGRQWKVKQPPLTGGGAEGPIEVVLSRRPAPGIVRSADHAGRRCEWAARLLARVSDAQWHDAFRAGAYGAEVRSRFIAKLKSKIEDGLALDRQTDRD